MVKGINKQIIEIKCPNDEFFEKALLFVKADKADLPYALIAEHSERLLNGCAAEEEYGEEKKDNTRLLKTVILLMLPILAAAVGGCIWLIIKG